MDLAEYATTFAEPWTVKFVGYEPGGSTVVTNFVTDGIIDGIGPLTDFQTFTFGPEFSRLTCVEIPTVGWSLDNLRLRRDVPEPSAGGLIVLGMLCGLGGRVLGRRRCQPD